MTKDDRLHVLERLESGELNVDQALGELAGAAESDSSGPAREGWAEGQVIPEWISTSWKYWWMLPFTIGVVLTGTGVWLAQYGGWWWLLAGPALVIGVPLTLVAVASTSSPWLHVRVQNRKGSWPRTVGVSIPIPARPLAWVLRVFGSRIPKLRDTALDEVVLALEEGGANSAPLHVEVDEGPEGERIEVYIG